MASTTSETGADDERSTARFSVDWRETTRRVVGFARTVVRALAFVFAAVLVIHVVLTVGSANPDNGLTQFVSDWAANLTLGLKDLFRPSATALQVILDYGLPALVWLVLGAVVARVLSLVSP